MKLIIAITTVVSIVVLMFMILSLQYRDSAINFQSNYKYDNSVKFYDYYLENSELLFLQNKVTNRVSINAGNKPVNVIYSLSILSQKYFEEYEWERVDYNLNYWRYLPPSGCDQSYIRSYVSGDINRTDISINVNNAPTTIGDSLVYWQGCTNGISKN